MIDDFPWYRVLDPDARLHQGEFIFGCPVARWRAVTLEDVKPEEAAHYEKRDVVVMSQDCDLENNKIPFVIVCPAPAEGEAKEDWVTWRNNNGKSATDGEWKGRLSNMVRGRETALALLEDLPAAHGGEKRIVDFKEVYTVPRVFAESAVRGKEDRLMLSPPYREHLSQSFARFFMRVGLPSPVTL